MCVNPAWSESYVVLRVCMYSVCVVHARCVCIYCIVIVGMIKCVEISSIHCRFIIHAVLLCTQPLSQLTTVFQCKVQLCLTLSLTLKLRKTRLYNCCACMLQ